MSFIRKVKKGNSIYLAEVENVRVDGKVVQRHIKYVGKEVDDKTVLSSSISNISIESIKLHGPLLVLNYFCKKINLANILGEYGNEILSLVFAHCIHYKSINKMQQWFERTDLNLILNLENLTENRLLKALDSIKENGIQKIQTDIFEEVKNYYKLDPSSVVYDVTNTYLYGKKCPYAKFGKDKERIKGRPLIQIGLGVTKDEGIPIFHKTFNGNIADARTLIDLITPLEQYNITKGLIIYDRGITSATAIKEMKKLGWDTICGIASNNRLKKIITPLKNNIINRRYRFKLNKTILYVLHQKHTIQNITGTLLICYNEQLAKDIRESRNDEIYNAQMLLKQDKPTKQGLEKFFYKSNKINEKIILEEEQFDGFSFIFSTKNFAVSEILKLYYRDKDVVEKAFTSLKGVVKVRPIRHWLYDRVTAHVFICYLSYLLLSLLKFSLQKINISPTEALEELSTLYKVYIKDGKKGFKLSRTVALTKNQEKILKTIDKKLLSECSV